MHNFMLVKELEPKEYFKVVHRIFRMPKEVFLNNTTGNQELDEESAQQFVTAYLQWKEPDTDRIVGMVRGEEHAEEIVLDATIRYPIVKEQSRH